MGRLLLLVGFEIFFLIEMLMNGKNEPAWGISFAGWLVSFGAFWFVYRVTIRIKR